MSGLYPYRIPLLLYRIDIEYNLAGTKKTHSPSLYIYYKKKNLFFSSHTILLCVVEGTFNVLYA